jgi:hypothetical protein
MKMTLLEMTQDIMSDMDSDVINSIDDTDESRQVAQILKTTYFAMQSTRNWPSTKELIPLTNLGQTDRPNYLFGVSEIKELDLMIMNYDKRKAGETRTRFDPVIYLYPDEFLRKVNQYNSDESNTQTIADASGVTYSIMNDRAPSHFTSFNDKSLAFNSYDIGVDTTLQSAKVQAFGYVTPDWTHTDNSTPVLPDEAFISLLEEAKVKAMFKLKQTQDPTAMAEARRQKTWLSRKAFKVKGGVRYPNYGRKGGKNTNPYFDKNDTTPTE